MKYKYSMWVVFLVIADVGIASLYRLIQNQPAVTDTQLFSPKPREAASASLASTSSIPSPIPSPMVSPTQTADPKSQADVAYKKGDYPTAIAQYKIAIDAASNNADKAELWNRLANSYRDSKKYSDADKAYQQATTLNPNLVVAYINQANVYVTEKNRSQAKATLEKGLKANPGNADLKRELSILNLSGTESEAR